MFGISILKCLKKDPYTKEIFIGVFPRDKLPKITSYPQCFIFNNQNQNRPGEHWMAMFFTKDKKCIFFDSYAHEPAHFGLVNYIRENSTSYASNKLRIQGDSMYCGYYCLAFLLLMARNKIHIFYKAFTANSSNNDKKLKKLISEC